MIPHPSAEGLLARHGRSLAGRRTARLELADTIAWRANEFAARSDACASGRHRGPTSNWGCSNDGTNCLCECHDPEEPKP